MYTYERFNVRLFPWFLIIVALIFTFSGMYLEGALVGTPGGLLVVSWKGININAADQTIRVYDKFLWFYIGKWQHIPKPLYVTVVRINLSASRTAAIPFIAPQEGKSTVAYKINLIVDGHQRFVPIARGKRAEMLEEAWKIARLLDIRLLDHTTCDKVWLK
jgi:hypothetical protein